MAQAVTDENFEQYLQMYLPIVQSDFAEALEQAEGARGCDVVTDLTIIGNTLSMPGVKYTTNPITDPEAVAEKYVQIPYSILSSALQGMLDATANADLDHERAEQDHETVTEQGDYAKEQGDYAKEQGDLIVFATVQTCQSIIGELT